MEKIQANLTDGFYVTLTNDAAKEVREELVKLVKRTFLCLAILFLFVWIISREQTLSFCYSDFIICQRVDSRYFLLLV